MKYILVPVLLLLSFSSSAQKNDKSPFEKFGKVSVENLKTKIYSIDSSAKAIILSDIGDVSITGNRDGWFSLVSKKHVVIHILNKNGYDQANIEIQLYGSGLDKEEVSKLRAVTYNLEDGKIVETKLDKSGQFKEKIDENREKIKFTLPRVKEGSIIEYEYVVTSKFITEPDPWYFQKLTAPVLWSEYNFSAPEFFTYQFLSQGNQPMQKAENKTRPETFTVLESGGSLQTEHINIASKVTDYQWIVKNAPELKLENFTTSLFNHISRMTVQLVQQRDPLQFRSFRGSWTEIMKKLMSSESFGSKLNANNNWMKDDVTPLYAGSKDDVEKAKKIYAYVRDNFKNTGEYGIYLQQGLKDVFKTKKGTTAEINLLLTAMLRYANLSADPVLLSTTDHGYSFELMPVLNTMNYVIVQFKGNGNTYYLDAGTPRLGFNKLQPFCYNGHSRVVNQDATAINLSPDSLKESKRTSFFIVNDSTNTKWMASVTNNLGYIQSKSVRDEISEKGESEFFKDIQKSYTSSTVYKPTIEQLKNLDENVVLKYGLDFDLGDVDVLYINPLFSEGYKKNPFTGETRSYPVEMPYTQEEIITAMIEVPKGYQVDEMPKQIKLNYDQEGKTTFEYRITQSDNIISFMCKLIIDHTYFEPDEYAILREFFGMVVKKQSEQIVFKKIKK